MFLKQCSDTYPSINLYLYIIISVLYCCVVILTCIFVCVFSLSLCFLLYILCVKSKGHSSAVQEHAGNLPKSLAERFLNSYLSRELFDVLVSRSDFIELSNWTTEFTEFITQEEVSELEFTFEAVDVSNRNRSEMQSVDFTLNTPAQYKMLSLFGINTLFSERKEAYLFSPV